MKQSGLLIVLLFLVLLIQAQQLKPVLYNDGSQQLNGWITSNTGEKLPGVVILPAWKGVDNEARTTAAELAKQGYIAFIADIYGEGNTPADNAAAAKIAGQYKQDYKAYQQRIAIAVEQIKKEGALPGKIAVIGYCFGGTGALETARGGLPVVGVISIHGGLNKAADRPNAPVTTKILVQHPANDRSVSKTDYDNLVQEMNEGKADWQIITYANSGHTFTNPESGEYNAVMAKRAWKHALMFLEEVLK